jgi:RimJ/RimL family protein N-acetyltransferase
MKVTLREFRREDLAAVNRWREDRRVTDGFGAPHRFIGPEVDDAWFDTYLSRRGRDVRCAICLDEGDEPVGLVTLTDIDPVHAQAEFHIMIGPPEATGRGVATAATREMLRHAFRDLNLHRVFLSVLDSNDRAIRVYEKVGFRREGVLREAAYKDGWYRDVIVMSILKSEFGIEP